MAAAGFFRACYLSHFSKPASDRIVYRIIQRYKARQILEIGLGDGQRTGRMIEMARRCWPDGRISYTGIDPFESRTPKDPPGMTLKGAHQILGRTGARIRLIPGDPGAALAATANELMGTDLVVISAWLDSKSLERTWFYLPRIIHAGSCVVRQETDPDGQVVTRILVAPEMPRRAVEEALRKAA